MASLLISVDSKKPFGSAKEARTLMRKIADYLDGNQYSGITNVQLSTNESTALATGSLAYASSGYQISGGSGSITATINGTAVAVTWATSDTNTAGLLATAINANTSVNMLVEASNSVAQLNIGTPAVDSKLVVCGVEFVGVTTAILNNQFAVGSAAASLITAINQHPSLKAKVYATGPNGGGNIVICKRKNYTIKASDQVSQSGFSAIVNPSFAATNSMGVCCLTPGVVGNCITVTASGTGNSVSFGAGGKLVGGLNGFTSIVKAY